ncbi:hypothetical protein BJ981_001558 [Sphaerisporangium krabiense]|uniref:Uncharacterized protein n=1 Tax=Sphaerisporangium krabiense TaxID=763782 RepID=A0A7W8Z1S9_9ACTN|nr:hypothetical protein [Sphaerisporangium krabiense]
MADADRLSRSSPAVRRPHRTRFSSIAGNFSPSPRDL